MSDDERESGRVELELLGDRVAEAVSRAQDEVIAAALNEPETRARIAEFTRRRFQSELDNYLNTSQGHSWRFKDIIEKAINVEAAQLAAQPEMVEKIRSAVVDGIGRIQWVEDRQGRSRNLVDVGGVIAGVASKLLKEAADLVICHVKNAKS